MPGRRARLTYGLDNTKPLASLLMFHGYQRFFLWHAFVTGGEAVYVVAKRNKTLSCVCKNCLCSRDTLLHLIVLNSRLCRVCCAGECVPYMLLNLLRRLHLHVINII